MGTKGETAKRLTKRTELVCQYSWRLFVSAVTFKHPDKRNYFVICRSMLAQFLFNMFKVENPDEFAFRSEQLKRNGTWTKLSFSGPLKQMCDQLYSNLSDQWPYNYDNVFHNRLWVVIRGFILAPRGGFKQGHTQDIWSVQKKSLCWKQNTLTDPSGRLDVQMTLPETEGEREVKMLQ